MNASPRPERILLGAVSLLLAMMLWLQVAVTETPNLQREVSVPLEVRNLGNDLLPVDAPPRVAVLFEGPQRDLDAISAEQWTAFVDATGVSAGSRELEVKASGPVTARLLYRTRQRVIKIDFDPVSRVERPVTVETRGRRPEDLRYDGAAVMPDQVMITGPATVMRDVRAVRASLDLSRIRPGVSYNVPVEILGPNNRPIPQARAEPASVTVFPAVAAAPATGSVLITPIWRGSPALGFRVTGYEFRPNQVMLTGEAEALAALRIVETQPINLAGLRQNTTIAVPLRVPSGLRQRTAGPVMVTVRIAPSPAPPAATVVPPTPAPTTLRPDPDRVDNPLEGGP